MRHGDCFAEFARSDTPKLICTPRERKFTHCKETHGLTAWSQVFALNHPTRGIIGLQP
jgi:hypothetical protein